MFKLFLGKFQRSPSPISMKGVGLAGNSLPLKRRNSRVVQSPWGHDSNLSSSGNIYPGKQNKTPCLWKWVGSGRPAAQEQHKATAQQPPEDQGASWPYFFLMTLFRLWYTSAPMIIASLKLAAPTGRIMNSSRPGGWAPRKPPTPPLPFMFLWGRIGISHKIPSTPRMSQLWEGTWKIIFLL